MAILQYSSRIGIFATFISVKLYHHESIGIRSQLRILPTVFFVNLEHSLSFKYEQKAYSSWLSMLRDEVLRCVSSRRQAISLQSVTKIIQERKEKYRLAS